MTKAAAIEKATWAAERYIATLATMDEDLRDDLRQEARIAAWKAAEERMEEPNAAFLMMTAVGAVKNFLGRRAHTIRPPEHAWGRGEAPAYLMDSLTEAIDPRSPEEQVLAESVVEEFVARLTPQQRRYLALRLAGYGSSDASMHLGITKQAGSCLLQNIRTRYEAWRAETS